MSQNQLPRRVSGESDGDGIGWDALLVEDFGELSQVGACADYLALVDDDIAVGVGSPQFLPVGVEVFHIGTELLVGFRGQFG